MFPMSYYDSLESIDPRRIQISDGLEGLAASGDIGGALEYLKKGYMGATDDFVTGGQKVIRNTVGLGTRGSSINANAFQKGVSRLAGSGAFRGAMRALPALGAISGVAAAGDILTGEESAANKAMDLTLGAAGAAGALKLGAMGAAAGSVVPGIGTVVGGLGGAVLGGLGGFSVGKAASDVFQYVGGDKKSPEQRKLEEALKALNGGLV